MTSENFEHVVIYTPEQTAEYKKRDQKRRARVIQKERGIKYTTALREIQRQDEEASQE